MKHIITGLLLSMMSTVDWGGSSFGKDKNWMRGFRHLVLGLVNTVQLHSV